MTSSGSINGKWALVTGASRGIGRQIALGLAGQGCNVIVHARKLEHAADTVAMVQRYGVHTHSVEGDLSSPEETNRLIQSVLIRFDGVDILYNNAAISTPPKPIGEFAQEEWKKLFQVNFYSLIMLCNAFAPGMVKQGYGRIVNLTSGIRDQPELAPYGASKAAVDKYTQDLAYSLLDTGVLVNRLDPGWLRTELGGSGADNHVNTVLPGAIMPILQNNDGMTGRLFRAQDYRDTI
ncbi:SDR family NAD(P)-dependent oxidoreductase [Cohnella cholangitidis]|uniref:SDR family oxidoreductase n=1 Tax=Cohnella cholangitidis TaxID=2598458 RepID=A0A7G5C366_9BACL|nr:SDR family oxidoreductase [Cohnella cholangitidis]QMV43650.1 SDR family oxidoreductase [Cohnella cholangitidis]